MNAVSMASGLIYARRFEILITKSTSVSVLLWPQKTLFTRSTSENSSKSYCESIKVKLNINKRWIQSKVCWTSGNKPITQRGWWRTSGILVATLRCFVVNFMDQGDATFQFRFYCFGKATRWRLKKCRILMKLIHHVESIKLDSKLSAGPQH
jgi:uncharacterized UPF0160 family protein